MPFAPGIDNDSTPPPDALTSGLPAIATARVPDIEEVIQDVQTNAYAAENEQLGRAIRTAMGLGALAMLPNLIQELRLSKDPDARIKFIQMALKEGGFGTKDNKNDHLPVFHFNFIGAGQSMQVVAEVSKDDVSDAVMVEKFAPSSKHERFAVLNDEVSVPEKPENVFDLIAGG